MEYRLKVIVENNKYKNFKPIILLTNNFVMLFTDQDLIIMDDLFVEIQRIIKVHLVYVFKYIFSIFKQFYTFFHTFFYLHLFSKNTNNVTITKFRNGFETALGLYIAVACWTMKIKNMTHYFICKSFFFPLDLLGLSLCKILPNGINDGVTV